MPFAKERFPAACAPEKFKELGLLVRVIWQHMVGPVLRIGARVYQSCNNAMILVDISQQHSACFVWVMPLNILQDLITPQILG